MLYLEELERKIMSECNWKRFIIKNSARGEYWIECNLQTHIHTPLFGVKFILDSRDGQ